MKTAIAFLRSDRPLDYGRRLSRFRWERAFPAGGVAEMAAGDSAREAFASADAWIVVTDEAALPWPLECFPVPAPGRVLAASAGQTVAPAHTLREIETLPVSRGAPTSPSAIAFHAADFPAAAGETVEELVARLISESVAEDRETGFRAFAFGDPSESERTELTRLVPAACRRLLDVGCGAGGSSAALKARAAALRVTGVERDGRSAAKARGRLDRVLAGDAPRALDELAREGETFDAFLFADVLEHLEDPSGTLVRARSLAAPGAVLVASVPNAGHLSLVRDLVLGRFDPVPAGLADAGHLRWFTRASLRETLEESGWRVRAIEPWPGAAAVESGDFVAKLADWPGLDRESLATYQWIAVASAAPPGE